MWEANHNRVIVGVIVGGTTITPPILCGSGRSNHPTGSYRPTGACVAAHAAARPATWRQRGSRRARGRKLVAARLAPSKAAAVLVSSCSPRPSRARCCISTRPCAQQPAGASLVVALAAHVGATPAVASEKFSRTPLAQGSRARRSPKVLAHTPWLLTPPRAPQSPARGRLTSKSASCEETKECKTHSHNI